MAALDPLSVNSLTISAKGNEVSPGVWHASYNFKSGQHVVFGASVVNGWPTPSEAEDHAIDIGVNTFANWLDSGVKDRLRIVFPTFIAVLDVSRLTNGNWHCLAYIEKAGNSSGTVDAPEKETVSDAIAAAIAAVEKRASASH
ncbi:MAG: hypothetical protein K2X55_10235 [Burkholderiaceae bacterium]|nr:hypothetical protein [Burkholderiaceae bacterium]